MVIDRAQTRNAFKAAKVNKDNLLVVYEYNKRAWMLSGLWYEYLATLEKNMRKQGRRILYISLQLSHLTIMLPMPFHLEYVTSEIQIAASLLHVGLIN